MFNNLVFGTGKSKDKFEDVLEAFELYFLLMQSYLLGSCYSGAYENQVVLCEQT